MDFIQACLNICSPNTSVSRENGVFEIRTQVMSVDPYYFYSISYNYTQGSLTFTSYVKFDIFQVKGT